MSFLRLGPARQLLSDSRGANTSDSMMQVLSQTAVEMPWFARPLSQEPLCLKKKGWKVRRRLSSDILLPEDPRDWSRTDVCHWVQWMCTKHGLAPPDTTRFLMNGKAVCLMSVPMFTSRLPLGGKLLYRDFQIRLAQAMHKV